MLAVALENDDALYWEVDMPKQPLPKHKQPQAEEESLDDSVLTMKMAMSVKKTPKSALKGATPTTEKGQTQTRFTGNSKMVTSQVTTISQLTEMVSIVQQENKTIMSHFNTLTEQIAALLSAQNISTTNCPVGGHGSESGHSK